MAAKNYVLVVVALLHFLLGLAMSAQYPEGFIMRGECLDDNEPPLRVAHKPQINHNVVGDSIPGIMNIDDCAYECYKNAECGYFTWYKSKMSEKDQDEAPCQLVGFNLKQACFNLEGRCVLLKECEKFNDTCHKCRTGAKPYFNPKEDWQTLVVNGRSDNRNYKQEKIDQYESTEVIELIMGGDDGVCPLSTTGLVPRYGSCMAYVNETVVVCGGYTGYSNKDPESTYTDLCQKFVGRDEDGRPISWANVNPLNQARAFASSAEVVVDSGDVVFYVLGGYEVSAGFLDSVEKYNSVNEDFSIVPGMVMPQKKSHFCSVYVDYNDTKSLFTIGGWNIDYYSGVQRMILDGATGEGTLWTDAPPLQQERADHACAVVQYKWQIGIMAAGGYKLDGAWTRTVEFFDLAKSEWTKLLFFPQLTDGRHYHGLTTIGMIPTVFSGWNNGSLSSIEMLNFDASPTPKWDEYQGYMKIPREKFAYTKVPVSFLQDCREENEDA